MLYLYLDESGDLGFDFINKKPSAFFTICVLAIKGRENDRRLANIVRAVISRKLGRRSGNRQVELKGTGTSFTIKRFFYKKAEQIDFKLHTVTLNKQRFHSRLMEDKERIYNYVARLTLEEVDFNEAAVRVIITVDKSKTRPEIQRFNNYILTQIKARLDPLVPLEIFHAYSEGSPALQATDMFAWGVFRKHENGDTEWYDIFKARLYSEKLYLP